MDRRDMLKSAVVAGVGMGFAATSPQAMAASPLPSVPAARFPAASFLRTRDGADLFYRDWGTGKPVVFLSGWALCSPDCSPRPQSRPASANKPPRSCAPAAPPHGSTTNR